MTVSIENAKNTKTFNYYGEIILCARQTTLYCHYNDIYLYYYITWVTMGFLRRVAGIFLRNKVRSSVISGELGVELLLLCIERSQLRWFDHLLRRPPGGGVQGTSSWEEAPGQTQAKVERSYLSSGWGTSWDPWVRAGWCGQGKSVAPCWHCCLPDPWWRWMDEWITSCNLYLQTLLPWYLNGYMRITQE